MVMPRIGVLALQGDFARHREAFAEVGARPVEVRHAAELSDLDALVIPGGESTTLLRLMEHEPWFPALREFHAHGGTLFGTCAGAILLAREVLDPQQPSLGLIDAVIRRNAFGRQIDSFETELDVAGLERPVPAVFIRAPRFVGLGPGVQVLGRLGDEPVLVREGSVLAATFHPELTSDRELQRMFLEMATEKGRVPC
jgi:pyridoxal 5'-phosphate synthase pdxT subunit